MGAVWVDSQRDLVVAGVVIHNLLGPLIVDYAVFGHRSIHRLWSTRLRNGLTEQFDHSGLTSMCNILMNGQIIGTTVYKGIRVALRNRVAYNALQSLGI